MPVAWIVSGSPSRRHAGVAPEPAGVVEHLRAARAALGDRERAVRVARQQHALGQVGRRASGGSGWRRHGGGRYGRLRPRMAQDAPAAAAGRRARRRRAHGPGDARLGAADARARAGGGRRDRARRRARAPRRRARCARRSTTRRPATHEDLRELQAELRAIGRRLDAIEERLPGASAVREARAGKQAQAPSSGGAAAGC